MGKRLGQHFLKDSETAKQIVATAMLGENSKVLEIGSGKGALTEILLASGARVYAVEHDAQLFESLHTKLSRYIKGVPRLVLVHNDILKVELNPQLLFGTAEPFDIVANIPYYLTTPLIMKLIPIRSHLRRVLLTVQNEVAERAVALHNTSKTYGSLSVAVQHAFQPCLHFQIPPEAFSPPPKVHSAVLSLLPKEQSLAPELERKFLQWSKQIFSQRRKQFSNILAQKGIVSSSSTARTQVADQATAPPTPQVAVSASTKLTLPPNWKSLRPEVFSPSQLLQIFLNESNQ